MQQLRAGVTIISIRGANAINQDPFAKQLFSYPRPGETGNLPRNLLNGSMYFNWDAGLSKNIRFSESMRLQLCAEFKVLKLNQANFTIGDFNIGHVTNFGKIGSNYTPRIIQLGARFDF